MPYFSWIRHINLPRQTFWTSSLAWAAPTLAALSILSPSAYSQTPIEASAPSRNLAADRQIDGARRPGRPPIPARPWRKTDKPWRKSSFQNICERMDELKFSGRVCNLSSKEITSLSSGDFDGLSDLLILYLNKNDLSSLPEDIFAGLSNLRRLYLGKNDLSSLPEDIFAGLSNLKRLYLNDNDLSSLPEDIFAGLSNLQALYLGKNDLSSLPEDIFAGLSNLQALYLNDNDLSSLPENIFAGLSNLQALYLGKNDLSSLPEDIFAGLSNLQRLYLNDNDQSSLPEDIFTGLSSLQYLYLGKNDLSSLPEGVFAGLSNLQKLYLNDNDQGSLPEDIFTGLSSLQYLYLGKNDLSSLPEDIFAGLSNLKRLYLNDNDLSSLPEDIFAGLSDLAYLYLNKNDLSSLPEDIFAGLSNLQRLYLNDNDLSRLPEDIFDGLSDLAYIDLSGNSLICLPISLPLSVTVSPADLPRCGNFLVFTPISLTVAEGGSGSYTVALASQPTATVTVTVSSGAGVTLDTDATTNGNQNTLSFSTANWSTPQTVEVSPRQDDDAVNDIVTLSHTANSSDYSSIIANLSVAVTDDETAALLLTPSSLTVAEGGSGSYTVTLASQPTDTVTVTISSGSGVVTRDTDPVSNGHQNTLTFSTANWSRPQIVQVVGREDDDAVDDTVTLSHTASGGDYGSVTADLKVTVTDTAALLLTPSSLTVTEGGSGSYTVALASQPTAAVTVSLAPGSGEMLNLVWDTDTATDGNQNTLSFTTENWSTPQTVEVSAGQDDDAIDHIVPLSHIASGGGYGSVTADLNVTVIDDETAALLLTPSSLAVTEGGSGSYTVTLASQPTDTVTVTISSGSGVVTRDTDPGSNGHQNTLTFTTANWSTAQTVQVGGRKDNDTVDDTVTLSHTASGGDYDSVTADLKVTVTDTTALLLTPASLAVAEGGGGSYTVALASQPTDTVTVTIMSGSGVTVDADAATNGNQNTLSFTTANWSTPQTVDVNGDQDDDVIDETVTLAHTASGGGYGSATASLGVTVIDADKEPALTLTPSSLTVLAGSSGSYTVALASKPTAAVTVSLSSGSGVTVDTDADTNGNQTNLSFSAANWSNPQAVEVSVDQDVDNTATLSHTASGGNYGSVTASLSVYIQNICERKNALNSNGKTCTLSSKGITSLNSGDFAGLSNLENIYLDRNELTSLPEDIFAGLSNLQYIGLSRNNLNNLPEDIFDELSNLRRLALSNNVLVNLPEDIFDGLSKLRYLALSNNILANLPEDIFDELSNLETLYLSNNNLSNLPEDIFDGLSDLEDLFLRYNDLSNLPEDIFDGLSNLENLYLTDNNLSSLPEDTFDGLSNLQNLYLNDNNLSSLPEDIFDGLSNLEDLYLNDNNLSNLSEDIFDELSNLQKLYLNNNSLICFLKTKSLPLGAYVDVNLPRCNELLVFTPSSLTLAEGGSGSYTVALASSPNAAVTVITISAGAGVTLDTDAGTNGNQNTLSFSTANWNTPQTVTVSAEQDDDAVDDIVTLSHTASGGNYSLVSGDLVVTVTDDKMAALLLTPSSLTLVGGGRGSYTVALASQPTAAVTVTLSSGSGVTLDTDADTNGNQNTLTFSTTNWSTPQTVNVNVGQDVNNTVTLSHSASGGDYSSVTASLSVNVQNICQRMDALDSNGTSCRLSSKGITSLNSGDFDGLTSLKYLYLHSNDLSSLPEDIFTGLSNLKQLQLDNNNLSSLPKYIFAGLFKLQYLWLNNNDLSSLPEDIFDGLSDLEYLYLDDNNLSSLPEDIFDGLSDLYILFLYNNDLSSLPEDVFDGLSDLEILRLNDNNLSSLPEDIFDGLSDLDKLYLNDNSLTCLPKSLPLSVDVDVDLPQCGNTNTTAALPSWITADGTLEPLTLYVGGEDGSRDVSTAFSVDNDKAGDITWHFASSHPAVASVEPESSGSSMLIVTPVREGEATITVTATAANRNGMSDSASLSFLVTVVTSPAEETAIRAALSGQGRVILGSVTDMIGKRFDSGTGGTGSFGSVCLSPAAGADGESATSGESGSSGDNAIAGSYGDSSDHLIASDSWQGESWNTDLSATGLRGVPHVSQRDEDSMDKTFDDLLKLFRGRPHSLHPADWVGQCGSGTVGDVSRPWTLWAGTDLQWARGGTETSDFDGEWQLYYLGADRAFREQWLAGLSLSQVQGEVDYSFEDATAAGAGQLSSNLTAIYPYLHGQLSSNLELWAIGGIGFGDVENEREHVDGDADQGDLHMRLLSLGLRRPLSQAGSTIDLALTSDAGFLTLSTEGDGSLDGAEASIGRFRLGLELSRPFASGVEPFAQLHGRYDSGDGPTGAAGEVVLGLRYGDERFNLELRGNHLASAAELEQWGANARLDYSPATNGTGLNLALTSQWGAAENGDSFLDGHTMKLPTPALISAGDGDSLPGEISGEIGYSLSMGQQWGILTPNLGYDHSDNGSSRSRVGLAYAFSSALDRDMELRLDLARRERRQEDPDHSIELSTTLRF